MRKVLSLVFLLSASPSALLAKSAMDMVDQYTDILENKRYLLSDESVQHYAQALRDLIFNGKTHAAKSEDGFAPIDKKDYGFRTSITEDETKRLTKALTMLALAVPNDAVDVTGIDTEDLTDISSLHKPEMKEAIKDHRKKAFELYFHTFQGERSQDQAKALLEGQPNGKETYKDIIEGLSGEIVGIPVIFSLLERAYIKSDSRALWALEVLQRDSTIRKVLNASTKTSPYFDKGNWDQARQTILGKIRTKLPEKGFEEAAQEAAQLLKVNHSKENHYDDTISKLNKASPSSADIQGTIGHMLFKAWDDGGDKTILDALTILAQSPEGLVQINTYLTKMEPYYASTYNLKDEKWPKVKDMILFKQAKYKINNILNTDANTKSGMHDLNLAKTADDIAKSLIPLIYKTPDITVLEALKKLCDLKDGKTVIETALKSDATPEALKGQTAERAIEILDEQTKEWGDNVKLAVDSLADDFMSDDTGYYDQIIKYLKEPKSDINLALRDLLSAVCYKKSAGSMKALNFIANNSLGLNIINLYLKTHNNIDILRGKTWEQVKEITSKYYN